MKKKLSDDDFKDMVDQRLLQAEESIKKLQSYMNEIRIEANNVRDFDTSMKRIDDLNKEIIKFKDELSSTNARIDLSNRYIKLIRDDVYND